MKGLSEVTRAGRLFVKRFDKGPFGEALFRAEAEAYKALDPLGLVPDAFVTRGTDGRGTIVTATCAPMEAGCHREEIVAAVYRMHAAGWAHRDLRIENIVLDRGEVNFIDLEFACRVDPMIFRQDGPVKPYDLYGPEASGVPVPEMHRFLGISVWWDTKNDASLALARHFGALGDA